MFKNKIEFNAFDTNNKKVKNLEEPQIKALSKASVKKLLSKPEERTSFHLILNYFRNKAGRPLAHFLSVGINKKMDKHFEQVEMKSGKLDKSMSASQKEASMGEVYCKEEGGKKFLCFEPAPKSKIPQGKWPKILKALKPFLAGAKAVVIFEGNMIGEEDAEETTTSEAASETTASNNSEEKQVSQEQSTQEENTASAKDTTEVIGQFKYQLEEIAKHLKETLPKDIIPKIKNRTVEVADLDIVQEVREKINKFENAYQAAAENIQNKLTKMRASLVKQVPKVEQVITALEKLLVSSGNTNTKEEDTSALQELLELATNSLNDFDKNYDQLKEELENSTSEPLAGGDELLAQIG